MASGGADRASSTEQVVLPHRSHARSSVTIRAESAICNCSSQLQFYLLVACRDGRSLRIANLPTAPRRRPLRLSTPPLSEFGDAVLPTLRYVPSLIRSRASSAITTRFVSDLDRLFWHP